MFSYKSIESIENRLQEVIYDWHNLSPSQRAAKPDTFIREWFTGWFSDMSTAMKGYDLRTVIQYPRLYMEPHYRETFKAMDLGGKDAGFLSMMHGFGVFFLCVALAVKLV